MDFDKNPSPLSENCKNKNGAQKWRGGGEEGEGLFLTRTPYTQDSVCSHTFYNTNIKNISIVFTILETFPEKHLAFLMVVSTVHSGELRTPSVYAWWSLSLWCWK